MQHLSELPGHARRLVTGDSYRSVPIRSSRSGRSSLLSRDANACQRSRLQLDISRSCRAFSRMVLARFNRGKSLPSLGFPPPLLN